MAAKLVAKKYRTATAVEPRSPADMANMRLCLNRKFCQHDLRDDLQATGDEMIVEDCTRRPRGSGLSWGAAWVNGKWCGQNWLGKLWMELRAASIFGTCPPFLVLTGLGEPSSARSPPGRTLA